MSLRSGALPLALACCLAGCALSPSAPPPAVFDLGPPHDAAGAPRLRLRLAEVKAAPWLAEASLQYRLQFLDPQRREAYRDSRWAAPPADLVSLRLQQRLAQQPCAPGSAAAEVPLLQLSLDEFSQVFESAGRSHVLLRLRAALGTLPERSFELRREAPAADARGAVKAFAEATDACLDQVIAWVAQAAPAAACR